MPSEFDLIGVLRKKIGNKKIGDDCAAVPGRPGFYFLLTTDAFVEKVHVDFRKMTPENVGKKCAGAALSDIAAMAGTPLYLLVSLGLPVSFSEKKVKQFYDGLLKVTKRAGAEIVGGNITRSPVFWADITVVGEVKKNECKFRNGARVGDGIYVTGPLGGAALSGYRKIPEPRLAFGRFLGKIREVTSLIDVSDGLAADLGHLLEESSLGAVIFYEQIPKAASKPGLVLSGGEDYELLFTARPAVEQKLAGKFFKIGVMTKGKGLKIFDRRGKEMRLKKKGYDHFGCR